MEYEPEVAWDYELEVERDTAALWREYIVDSRATGLPPPPTPGSNLGGFSGELLGPNQGLVIQHRRE